MKGKDPTEAELKKLKKIASVMIQANKQIMDMGYNVYLDGSEHANVMKGPHHDDGSQTLSRMDNVVFHFNMKGWDGGDW